MSLLLGILLVIVGVLLLAFGLLCRLLAGAGGNKDVQRAQSFSNKVLLVGGASLLLAFILL